MLPNIPTDNLYKFLAISGLVLLLYSLTFPIVLFNKSIEKAERLSEELAGITADIKFLEEDVAIGKSQGESIDEAIQRFKNSREVRRQHAVLGEKLKAFQRINAQTRWLPILSITGAGFGFIISVIGFLLWYLKLQRPLDLSMGKNSATTEKKKTRK